ncbi:MAG: hypothetical protein LC104_19480 [Bacteroidales bacterium]|nr:hypothetical protein [Bacteroidales bacterium]
MDKSTTPILGFYHQPQWFFALAIIVLGQAGLTLELFGPEHALTGLTDSRPIIGGRHPLHLYHASLGAETFRDRWGTACYDPAFQAGYPKTPVFDGGCRPAEAVMVLAGKTTPSRAYKFGVFALCLIAPLVFAAATRAVGVAAPGAVLAATAGCLIWWSPHVRQILDAGNLDLLLAGLMGVLFVGGLVRYHAEPGLTGWLKMSAAAILGWYAQPIVWLGLLPILIVYYFALAPRHGLAWHLGLIGITAAGLAPNMWWLWDWGRFWWLRQPSIDEIAPFPEWHRFLGSTTEYTAMIGVEPVSWAIFVAGLFGLMALARARYWAAVGVTITAAGLAVIVTRLGETWPTLMIVRADRVAPFAVAILVPAASALVWGWWSVARHGRMAVIGVSLFPVLLGWGGFVAEPLRAGLGLNLEPLPLGFTIPQQDIIRGLQRRTNTDARILIEESDKRHPGWNWTALLPTYTQRAFLGGLDPDACVEHAFCGLRPGMLNGRPFSDWTDAERNNFCRRYNVGWVLCRSPEVWDWWLAMPGSHEIARFEDDGPLVLVELDRPRSYILSGSATVERIDRDGIVLIDAVPDAEGHLVLSLHHQPGFRAAPGVVQVDADPDPFDPIPMLKLRLPGRTSRIALTWENP